MSKAASSGEQLPSSAVTSNKPNITIITELKCCHNLSLRTCITWCVLHIRCCCPDHCLHHPAWTSLRPHSNEADLWDPHWAETPSPCGRTVSAKVASDMFQMLTSAKGPPRGPEPNHHVEPPLQAPQGVGHCLLGDGPQGHHVQVGVAVKCGQQGQRAGVQVSALQHLLLGQADIDLQGEQGFSM